MTTMTPTHPATYAPPAMPTPSAASGVTLYAIRLSVEDAVLARMGDDLTMAELREEVLLEIEEQFGITRGDTLAEGLDQLIDALARRARAEAA